MGLVFSHEKYSCVKAFTENAHIKLRGSRIGTKQTWLRSNNENNVSLYNEVADWKIIL